MPPAIKVANLGKEYLIGGKEKGNETFREMLTSSLAAPFRRLKKLKGQSTEEVRFWALNDISFEVQPGEVVGIIGRNGAGKSTLLKILSRITEPTKGSVEIRGRVSSLLEVGTGFHPELTGRENIYLNGAILGMSRQEIRAKFDEIVDFAEVEKFLDTPVKRYSSGMYVRLAFAVAAHLEPEILVVDEVLAVGDVAFQKKCLGKMQNIAGEGRTVLFVSHNIGAIRSLCSRAIMLEKGELRADAPTEQVVSRYLDMNLVKGAVATEEQISARLEGVIQRTNPSIRLLEVRICNEAKEPLDTFHSDEQVCVSVTYECIQLVADLRIVLKLLNNEGEVLMLTQQVDDSAMLHYCSRLNPGVYRAECVFPANTFGGKSFHLSVELINPKTEHLCINNILCFKILFKGYNNVQYGSGSNVFLRPKLSWVIERKEDQL